jgi:hypothetical protein
MSGRGHIRLMCKIQEKEMLLYVRYVKGHCTSFGRGVGVCLAEDGRDSGGTSSIGNGCGMSGETK